MECAPVGGHVFGSTKANSAKKRKLQDTLAKQDVLLKLSTHPRALHPQVARMSDDIDHAVVVMETPQPQLPAVILFLLLSSVLFLCLVSDADDGLERTLCDVLCVSVCVL